ncbi:hypothetical protein [Sphingomonas sp.]|uniref:hypothetical protein n=1 Tax=Sphingomonas sp. TaxID=28214 RepID=UPI002E147D94|nr:hypothetical protein [Sphingomonas sp.]
MSLALAIAAQTVAAVPSAGRLAFDCDMRGPGGAKSAARFKLRGTYDGAEVKTNMADWLKPSSPIKLKGGLQLSVENLVHHYEWKEAAGRERVNVRMIDYSNQQVAVLTIVRSYSDGRHSFDTLIGTGMCETRRGSPSQGTVQ